ncbi:universal stress protein [Trinickia sp. EG282A]|uniref:universal stress protein n=1 Tax=Trinickia sp. EG282A TaxID=3237013 RepID=UPI0034D198C8
MTYKTLLVHIDDSRKSHERVSFALDLALKYDACLIGLYVVCQDLFRPLLKGDESLVPAALEAQHAERANRAHDRFITAAEQAGCSFEWRAPPGPALDEAVLHARHADLVILGQEDPDDQDSYVARDFVEDMVMNVGRPVIVLPYAGHVATFGENIVVAWDGSREAARALADSIPILKRARFVTVCTVEKYPDREAPAGFDVAGYLERHGVRAAFKSIPRISGVGTGETLLNQVSDTHADLLVMGAYAHARARERVLGGVTHALLRTMTVPVLMSH